MKRRGQSGIEFLSVYAWAFIMIALGIGALYYFGVFDFSNLASERCIFPPQFQCVDFSLAPNTATLKLVNNLGEDIEITSLQMLELGTSNAMCTTATGLPLAWGEGTSSPPLTFTPCNNPFYVAGSSTEFRVRVEYRIPATEVTPHTYTLFGKVRGQVLTS